MADESVSTVTRKIQLVYRDYLFLILGVLVITGVILLTANSWSAIGRLRGEIETTKEELVQVEQAVTLLEQLGEGELSDKREIAERAIPREKPIFTMLESLNVLASTTGVSITDLSSSPGSLATASASLRESTKPSRATSLPYELVTITLQVKGEFESMKQFISGLGSMVPLVDLSEVRIRSQASTAEQVQFNGEMDLLAYWMQEPEIKLTKVDAKTFSRDDHQELVEKLKSFQEYEKSEGGFVSPTPLPLLIFEPQDLPENQLQVGDEVVE